MNIRVKAAWVVAVATCWDIIAHLIAPPLVYANPSPVFLNKALFVPIVTLALLIAFSVLAAVFLRIERVMTGSALQKGLRFGVAFAGLWLLGILEMSIVFDSPLHVELCSGLADASAIILLGVLLARWFASSSPPASRGVSVRLTTLLPFLLSWLALRYLGYHALGFESAHHTKPLTTLIWTAATGLWIGAIYLLLRPRSQRQQVRWFFPVVVFGINWALFTPFVFIFVTGPTPFTVAARIIADLVAVTIGTMIAEGIPQVERQQPWLIIKSRGRTWVE